MPHIEILAAHSATPVLTGLLSWLNSNSGAMEALGTLLLVAITAFYAWLLYRQLQAGRERGNAEHRAAVQAVFHELDAVAYPMQLMLQDGSSHLVIPFDFLGAYHQVLLPFLRDLPDDLAGRVTKAYGLLAVLMKSQGVGPNAQLLHIYNDDLVPAIEALRVHAADLGLHLTSNVAVVAKQDAILLTRQDVTRVA